ncbi:glycosyltransferase family 2 protein [Agrobacterium sp. CG674]
MKPDEYIAPFFSIVIPTRNRPEYLPDAIASVMRQTFSDFELIVSDNSDEAHAAENQRIIASYRGHERFQYIRPPSDLPMVDHWEWALRRTAGRYIGFLTDRMALRLYALQFAHNTIQSTQTPAICFASEDSIELPGYRSVRRISNALQVREVLSKDKLSEFSKGKLPKDTPRMLNSLVDKSVIAKIEEKYGSVFCSISPDYIFTFRLMGEIPAFTASTAPLLVTQGEKRSTGRAFKIGKMNSDSQGMLSNIRTIYGEWLKFGPIPGDVYLMPNVILREYDVVSSQHRGEEFTTISPVDFYTNAMNYCGNLARNGIVNERALAALESYRESHDLQFVSVQKRRHSVTRMWKMFVRGGSGSSGYLARMVGKIRLFLESMGAMFGLQSRHAASDLIAALQIDADNYRKNIADQERSK